LSLDIKELQELVEREKRIEENAKRAKEEAGNILKKAHEEAESIVQAIQLDPEWEKLKQKKNDEIIRKKAGIEEEYKRNVALLEKAAQENLEKAIERIIEETLKVKL
jgi:vacuolar-type H+-ATPase subunit H